MPRNLPWKVPAAPSSHSPLSSASKPKRNSTKRAPRNEDDGSTSPKKINHRKRRLSEDGSPSPSTPSKDFMCSGINADDAYIMVEDEFLATARTFTAPLHHAEYKRQKALARARKAAASPVFADVGSSSAMSAALRRQKAVAGNLARSRAALEAVGAMKSTNTLSDSDSSDFAALIGEDHAADGDDSGDDGPDFNNRASPPRADDPWLGTSLAPLLSPRKRRAEAHLTAPPSLVGLHGVRSDTRAARGYGASDTTERRPAARREFELPPATSSKPAARAAQVPGSASETEGDSDDLDVPVKPRSATTKGANSALPSGKNTLRPEYRSRLPSPPRRKVTDPTTIAKHEPVSSPSNSAAKTRLKPWMKNGKGAVRETGRKNLDVNEIPTFLV